MSPRVMRAMSAPVLSHLDGEMMTILDGIRASPTDFNIEIGAGLGPLAGKNWRVGLMGSGSTAQNLARFLTALRVVLNR